MRDILFRGQTRRKGEKVRMGDGKPIDSNWAYGGIFPQNKGGDFSIIYQYEPIEKHVVYADTVCEYAGIEDKNKTKVFEWDIVRCVYNGKLFIGVVVWNEDDLGFEASNMKNGADREFQYLGCCEEIEVIGNIFDNPDLLPTSSTDSD